MNIFSLGILYKPPSSPVNQAYDIYKTNNKTATLMLTTTNPDKSFGISDDFIYSNLYVIDGDLYSDSTKITTSGKVTAFSGRTTSSSYYSLYIEDGKLMSLTSGLVSAQIGSDTNWTKVCGYTNTSGEYRGYALKNDGLYIVNPTSVTLCSNITDWEVIKGYGSTSSSNYYGYGISEGKLYYLYANGSGAVQQGSDTGWTCVCASHEGSSYYGYGINAGKLYRLEGTPYQVGSDTGWIKVTGCTSSMFYVIGINAGKLYTIRNTTATQIGSSTDWLDCSGFYRSGYNGMACNSSALYYLSGSSSITKAMDGEFIKVYGYYGGSTPCGVAIRKAVV